MIQQNIPAAGSCSWC